MLVGSKVRWTLSAVVVTALTCCCVGVTSALAGQANRYTVDHMLAVEKIGRIFFTSDGNTLIYEQLGPISAVQNYFARPPGSRWNSRIMTADLRGQSAPRLLFPQEGALSYTLMGFSDDGRSVAYSEFGSERSFVGVSSIDGSRRQRFDLPFLGSDFSSVNGLEFVGNSTLGFPASLGREPISLQSLEYHHLQRGRRLENVRRGDVATAVSIGSGRFADVPGLNVALHLGDIYSGAAQPIERGRINTLVSSPTGDNYVILREMREQEGTSQLNLDPSGSTVYRVPVVYNRAGRRTELCGRCDVASGSLRWSESGRYLAYVARQVGAPWVTATPYLYDRDTDVATPADLGELSILMIAGGGLDHSRGAWIGDEFAMLLENTTDQSRVRDWYIVSADAPRNITGCVPAGSFELAGASNDRLVVISDGDAWAVGPTGLATNLTLSLAERITPWEVSPLAGIAQTTGTVTLRGQRNGRHFIAFVNLHGGAHEEVVAVNAGSEPVAVSPTSGRAAFLDRSSGSTKVYVLGSDGRRYDIVELNRHLLGVSGGVPMRVDHQGRDGTVRHSWLLVPPGAQRHDRIPTVVMVYPGRRFGNEWPFRMDMFIGTAGGPGGFFLASAGYAVLYPDISSDVSPNDDGPLDGVVEEVGLAIDAASNVGFIDPQLLAVQGWSFGGYTAATLIAQNERFRTAVVGAGPYNLLSSYGHFQHADRTHGDLTGIGLTNASASETGQLGMGTVPWEDPLKYLRNSPLIRVQSITVPIMLIHGDEDPISVTVAEEFFTALSRSRKDAVFVRYVGEAHGLQSPANIRDMWRRILDWYSQTLGPPLAASSAEALNHGF